MLDVAQAGHSAPPRSELLRAILDQSRVDFVLLDRECRFVLINAAFAQHIGKPVGAVLGHGYAEVFPDPRASIPALIPYVAEAIQSRAPVRVPGDVFASTTSADSSAACGDWLFEPILNADGEVEHLLSCHDGTSAAPGEKDLTRLNRALRLLSACNAALIHADKEQRLLETICRQIVDIGGYRMAWVGCIEQDDAGTLRPLGHAGIEAGFLNDIVVRWWDAKEGRGPANMALRTGTTQVVDDLMADPAIVPWQTAALQLGYRSCIALPLLDEDHAFGALTIYSSVAGAFVGQEVELLEELASDLAFGIQTLQTRTRRDVAEDRLSYLAEHDPLTGLPNRPLLRDRFDRAVAAAGREGAAVALMYLDLDHFKQINDALGHEAGDQVLVALVARLRKCIRDADTISRQGGDEFIVLLADIRDPGVVGRIAQEILTAISDPFEIHGTSLTTSFSIGISLFPDDGTDFDTLLKEADTALYRAKDAGRNTYSFFSRQMNVDAVARMQLQNSLRAAVRNREFQLHYQPQVDIGNGNIVGVEALIRWDRPGVGLVAPNDFIPAAEQSGLIVQIGEWVLNEACRQAEAWRRAGLAPMKMAVNLSAVQFKRGDLIETVTAALERSGLPAKYLELELTESVLVQDIETVMQTLGSLKRLGVQLSIDDFGTGYSSLSYLKRLAVDKLKIDQSFVRDLATDSENAAIVSAIIQLGRTLQLSVIAEGVETEHQLAFLHRADCDEMQGFLFSRPVPAADIEALLKEGRRLALPEPDEDSGKTILLVDDEEHVLSALSRALRPEGYCILRASSAGAALELLAAHSVGVILSDQRMPGMTGIELLRRAKQLYPDSIRIMISGFSDLESISEAINEGVFYKFLTKPWNDSQLRAQIKEAFQHYDLKQENERLTRQLGKAVSD